MHDVLNRGTFYSISYKKGIRKFQNVKLKK